MRFEEVQKIKQLIGSSVILSPMEKAEWLQLLPNMNDKQISELAAILTPKNIASFTPVKPSVSSPMTPIRPAVPPMPPKPAVTFPQSPKLPDIHQKEIPAHLTAITPIKPLTPENLQKKVEQAAEMYAKPTVERVEPIERAHLQIPQETFKESTYVNPDVLEALRSNQAVKSELPREKFKLGALITEDDFKDLTADMLHDYPNPEAFFKQVLDSLSKITPRSLLYAVIVAFEKSPLYHVYVDFGISLLNDPSENREQVYENTLKNAQQRGEPFLTRAEFEAMTDFRSQMDNYFV